MNQIRRFPYRGQMLTTPELARLAGCSPAAMRKRLLHGPAEEAVAMGPVDMSRKKRPPVIEIPPGARLIRSGFVVHERGVTRHTMGDA